MRAEKLACDSQLRDPVSSRLSISTCAPLLIKLTDIVTLLSSNILGVVYKNFEEHHMPPNTARIPHDIPQTT